MIEQLLQQAQTAYHAGNAAEAERLYHAISRMAPSHPGILAVLAHSQLMQEKWDAALLTYDRLLQMKPDFLEGLANRGILLQRMGRHAEALNTFNTAVKLHPTLAAPHNLRGTALSDLGNVSEAIAAFRQALALDPNFASAHFNLGTALGRFGMPAEAKSAFDCAFALDPDMPDLRASRFFIGYYLFKWDDYTGDCRILLDMVDGGEAMEPFRILYLPSTPLQQRVCAEKFAAQICPPVPAMPRNTPRKPGRLRVAYVSHAFNRHTVTFLLTEALEQHDREEFEIFAISHGIDDGSPARKRVSAACEHFVDVRNLNDSQIAEKIYALDIDIAIDLDGYTMEYRPAILSARPARLQVNYLGYPGTMGAAHIDYLIADDVITPPEHGAYYSEKLVWLPDNYLPGCTRPPAKKLSRAEAGLPDKGIVLCAFTAAYKISPDVFDCWLQILSRTPGSLLWLRVDSPTVQQNMCAVAEVAGIDPARLVFAPEADVSTHFGRLVWADLFLDTFMYGAHATASDALSAGMPVITLLGETFARRVAASLLTRANMPELITRSPEEYVNLAVSIANDAERLSALKEKVRLNSRHLFDATRFARHLESAYRKMWALHVSGKAPESFAVGG